MNTTGDKSTSKLPTRQEVIGWQEELERLKEEEAAMKARHAVEERAIRERRTMLNKFVEYGMALVDMDAQSEPEPISEGPSKPVVTLTRKKLKKPRARPARKRSKTWNATIKRIVASSGRGMTYREVKEEVAKTHLGETLRKTEKAFYGSIGKLSAMIGTAARSTAMRALSMPPSACPMTAVKTNAGDSGARVSNSTNARSLTSRLLVGALANVNSRAREARVVHTGLAYIRRVRPGRPGRRARLLLLHRWRVLRVAGRSPGHR